MLPVVKGQQALVVPVVRALERHLVVICYWLVRVTGGLWLLGATCEGSGQYLRRTDAWAGQAIIVFKSGSTKQADRQQRVRESRFCIQFRFVCEIFPRRVTEDTTITHSGNLGQESQAERAGILYPAQEMPALKDTIYHKPYVLIHILL